MSTRHQSLWFEDGNVILSMESVLFKVHRSMLGRLSPFFVVHFAETTEELYDGFPLIQLGAGVASCKDFEALLQHIYHDEPLHLASSFDQTARILRASTQYCFPRIRKLALACLGRLYPKKPLPFECLNWKYLTEASQLALECDALETLPALIYAMVTTQEFDIIDEAPITMANDTNAARSLKPLDRLCMRVMNRMMNHFAPILFTVPTSSHMECTGVFADHWMTFAIQPALDDSGVYKPLETLKKIQEVDWRSLGLCDACCEEKKKEWDDEANDIWSRMEDWIDITTSCHDLG